MTAVGAVGVLTGIGVYASASNRQDIYCDDGFSVYLCDRRDDGGRQVAGATMIVVSGVVAAVGLPLMLIGGKRVAVPVAEETPVASTMPEVRIGVGSGELRWSF